MPTFNELNKELSILEHKKQKILKQIKEFPEFSIRFITNSIKLDLKKWYVRTDAKGNPMDINKTDKVFQFTKFRILTPQHKSKIYNVVMESRFMNDSITEISIPVSIDRPILPQIFCSMVELNPFQLCTIQEELKRKEEEKQKNLKIQELENVIANAIKQLNELRK